MILVIIMYSHGTSHREQRYDIPYTLASFSEGLFSRTFFRKRQLFQEKSQQIPSGKSTFFRKRHITNDDR